MVLVYQYVIRSPLLLACKLGIVVHQFNKVDIYLTNVP